jgi:hypothetical protein
MWLKSSCINIGYQMKGYQNKFSNINPQDVEIEEDHGKGGMSEVGTGCRLNLEVKKKNKKTIFTRMSPVRT